MTATPTWKFWQTPLVVPLTEPLRRRLVEERGLSKEAGAGLRMVRQRRTYSDRTVTVFRVMDPAAVSQAGVALRHFRDLDDRQALQVHTGHIERDGQIVLNGS